MAPPSKEWKQPLAPKSSAGQEVGEWDISRVRTDERRMEPWDHGTTKHATGTVTGVVDVGDSQTDLRDAGCIGGWIAVRDFLPSCLSRLSCLSNEACFPPHGVALDVFCLWPATCHLPLALRAPSTLPASILVLFLPVSARHEYGSGGRNGRKARPAPAPAFLFPSTYMRLLAR